MSIIMDNTSIATILHEDVFVKLSDKIVELISGDPEVRSRGSGYGIEGFQFSNEELVLESCCLCAFLVTFSFQRSFAHLGAEKTGPILDLFHKFIHKGLDKISKEQQDRFPDILRDRFKCYYPAVTNDMEAMTGSEDALASYKLVDIFLDNLLSDPVDAAKDLITWRFLLSSDISGLHRVLLDTYNKILKHKIA
ncbi:MAG TPA: hypothetical protein ENG80_01315 [Nitrospirae bacterium]|nr:hypothetical protein BMS3Abin10_01415 [bacterium BMS3Abin10]GBE39540.1 hypothetical protein BMS3Bbin08_02166 [bacterium BMS3Bbin08]HDH00436.1 hypothetical protein [Nitrospirota bacterium]HDH50084.1 hypothetical protein [Nitrospirota bacterium]